MAFKHFIFSNLRHRHTQASLNSLLLQNNFQQCVCDFPMETLWTVTTFGVSYSIKVVSIVDSGPRGNLKWNKNNVLFNERYNNSAVFRRNRKECVSSKLNSETSTPPNHCIWQFYGNILFHLQSTFLPCGKVDIKEMQNIIC